MMRPALSRVLVAALGITLVGCGTRGPRTIGNPFDGDPAGVPEIRLRITNGNFYDATITVLGDNTQRRLGVVGGNSSATFTMDWEFSSGLRVRIDLLAGPTCTTDAIQVNPGDEVAFHIPSDLGTSGFCG